jgi:putative nucleotidyltransferase with HDIG domain
VAAHVGAALDRARLRGELEGTLMTTLAALCDALEQKDAYTAAHAHDVADLSEAVARRLELSTADVRTIRYAALLHDIGKIGIRTEILTKPGKLTDAEFAEMKQHTLIGQRILEPIPFFADVHRLVRWAHERWDARDDLHAPVPHRATPFRGDRGASPLRRLAVRSGRRGRRRRGSTRGRRT